MTEYCDSASPSSRARLLSICSNSTSTTTSARALSLAWMMRSATFTLSAVSRRMMALSWSFEAMRRESIRLRRMVIMSFTSAFERKNVWITRSS